MSLDALMLATQEKIIEAFNWSPSQVDMTPGGSAFPTAPQTFVSIHGADWTNSGGFEGKSSPYLDLDFGLYLTVSVRITIPADRHSILLRDRTRDTNKLCHQLAVLLHMNYEVMFRANELIPGDTMNKFIEPLRFRSCTTQKPQRGDWWMCEDDGPTYSGFSQTLIFQKARCIKPDPNPEDERHT